MNKKEEDLKRSVGLLGLPANIINIIILYFLSNLSINEIIATGIFIAVITIIYGIFKYLNKVSLK